MVDSVRQNFCEKILIPTDFICMFKMSFFFWHTLYFRKRKITENDVLQNTPNCTIDKKSGEYAPIPLNIMSAVIHYLLFLYKK